MEADKNQTSNEEQPTENIVLGDKSMDGFTQIGFQTVMEGIRSSNNLPHGRNWDYYSSFPSFSGIMDNEGERVLNLMSKVLHYQGIKGNIARRDLEEKFDLVVEANDTILERVGCNLDELSGICRNPEPLQLAEPAIPSISGSWNKNQLMSSSNKNTPMHPIKTTRNSPPPPKPAHMLFSRNVPKPQLNFKDKVDNSCNPFMPRIKEKPNALKPLAIRHELSETGYECYSHPYEFELEHFKPPSTQLKFQEPCNYKPLSETPLVMIEDADQLPVLLEDLSKYSEIAVDLEHHSYRSFQGFTCLMQISTHDIDYIVDAVKLRDELHCLNEVFTKPSVVKVFHGAGHDIEWLQRDLSLYIVNMFDTHEAARALNFSSLSLAHLLKYYCSITVNKDFQMADWRVRPLHDELLKYARQDTHYLIYIYHNMRNALLEAANGQSNILLSVIQSSTEICKKRYEKPILKDDSHMQLLRRHKKWFDNRQLFALKELYQWRDNFAREEDESTGYVLPNHMLMHIAEVLPREMQGILACCNPVPPIVRKNLLTLHHIVLKAREQPLVKPIFAEETQVRAVAKQIDVESALHCPHDLTHNEDFRDDLPTLLGNSLRVNRKVKEYRKKQPNISVFDTSLQLGFEEEDNLNDSAEVEERLSRVTFLPPYERYKKETPCAKKHQQKKDTEVLDNSSNIVQKEHSILESTQEEMESNHSRSNALEADIEKDPHVQRIKQHFMEVTAKLRQPKEASNKVQENLESSKQTTGEPLRNQLPKNRKRNRRRRARKDNKKLRPGEQMEIQYPPKAEFQKFNYSKVDFNNFKDGSSTSQSTSNQFQGQSKRKGKKNRSKKKRNQSATFKED